MDDYTATIWQRSFLTASGKKKTIQVLCGDISQAPDDYDVVVCSAFKGDYAPVPGTLIGTLWNEHRISVETLAQTPAVDVRTMGCWLSDEISAKFHRVACVEILSLSDVQYRLPSDDKPLSGAFSSLRFVLEQASIRGIPIRSVIAPFLGSGAQGIELCYIVSPLICQCIQALQTIDDLECFSFCDRSLRKAYELVAYLEKVVVSDVQQLDIFISYSSRQTELAYQMRENFLHRNLNCWMAPDSIPPGSSYQSEIPIALSNVPLVVLLLTLEAEQSRWVPKEIGAALDSGCILIPYQPYQYTIGQQFRFLLNGEQILFGWKYAEENRLDMLASFTMQKLLLNKNTNPSAIRFISDDTE